MRQRCAATLLWLFGQVLVNFCGIISNSTAAPNCKLIINYDLIGQPVAFQMPIRRVSHCGGRNANPMNSELNYHLIGFCRTLYNGHVPQVPPGALRVLLLPETAEERHLQRAGRQALLSRMLRPPLRMNSNLSCLVLIFSSPSPCSPPT